jgi:DNA-binding response OmpR family regulator
MTSILLVEDATDLAQVIIRELETAGYQVSLAGDGISALAAFAQQQPDMVILDWMLPKMDGLEVLRRLRETSAIPVLMLTARGDETDRVIGLEVGADDYLAKPFSLRELVARVRALLRRAERIQAMLKSDHAVGKAILRWENLTVDPEAYLAQLDGQTLDLTRTEFEMLHLLLRNPGRTFSRKYLLETIWDETYLEGDRSVDNAVLRLRKKLGQWGEYLETVWGIGYRLKAKK